MNSFETLLLTEIKDSNLGQEFIDFGQIIVEKFDVIHELFLDVDPELKSISNADFFSYFCSRLISILINSSADQSDFDEDEKDEFIAAFLIKFCHLIIRLIKIYEHNQQKNSLLN